MAAHALRGIHEFDDAALCLVWHRHLRCECGSQPNETRALCVVIAAAVTTVGIAVITFGFDV